MTDNTYDIVGIGLGPFNLGLAALVDGAPEELDAIFLEQDAEFNWHESMLIEGTTLEVPFLADLVTISDPTNEYSFLNYLRERDRIYEFYTYREFEILRREYNEYCRWVAESLDECRFSRRVTAVEATDDGYAVVAENPDTGESFSYRGEHVVVGIGSVPYVPDEFEGLPAEDVFHTASYLDRRDRCLDADSITVVGSGQSAAEVVKDLVQHQSDADYRLDWITRSDGFFQLEGSKLGHHVYTPDYVDYFYGLGDETRRQTLADQDFLYRGIDKSTGDDIFDLLYRRSIAERPDVRLMATTAVTDIEKCDERESTPTLYELTSHERQQDRTSTHESEVVILGTGYRRPWPEFLDPIEHQIRRTAGGDYRLTREYRIESTGPGELFAQNAGLHTHGMNTAHLGLGCYRNAVIINTILDEEVYPEVSDTGFQHFGVESFHDRSESDERQSARENALSTD